MLRLAAELHTSCNYRMLWKHASSLGLPFSVVWLEGQSVAHGRMAEKGAFAASRSD